VYPVGSSLRRLQGTNGKIQIIPPILGSVRALEVDIQHPVLPLGVKIS
jgi:hypothetical protein